MGAAPSWRNFIHPQGISMSIQQIQTGRMSPKQMDCAFLWLYCLDGQPYAKYLDAGAPREMPMALTLLRWDGRFGTMGGKVDPGENLRETLSREAAEEAGFWLTGDADIEQLGTFQDGDWHIHAFAHEASYVELVDARAKASAARHASPECAGWAIVPTGHYLPGDNGARGVEAFRLNHFASTAGLEFEALLQKIADKLAARQAVTV
ncbi:NUDIX domain-containing protein [Burkholderia ambifaria]|uniref:NUDIX domain-containing protein n=1 Tax=Burkholderia ambifaria TaxID=152480 RepID=UPI000F8046D9|nr:NUDIX domain-containing protein [Burkholderia ambifaria]